MTYILLVQVFSSSPWKQYTKNENEKNPSTLSKTDDRGWMVGDLDYMHSTSMQNKVSQNSNTLSKPMISIQIMTNAL